MANLSDTKINGTLTLNNGGEIADVQAMLEDLENRIALLESSYSLVAGCENIHIKTGTKVYNASGTSDPIFTMAEIQELFGVDDGVAWHYMVTVMNGDGAANSTHFQSCTYDSNAFHVVYPSNQTARSRLNWCAIYNPNAKDIT